MSTSNFETTTIESTPPRKDSKNLIIGILGGAILVMGGYLIFDKNKTGEMIDSQQSQISKVTTEKSEIQKSFDASLVRLDSMTSANTGLEGKLTESNEEITKVKSEIRSILNKSNATASELKKARNLIASLNDKLGGMEQEIARLTTENETLNQDKVVLTADKEKLTQDLTTTNTAKLELEEKVSVASTLNASNINITPVDVKGDGKEKVSTKAKKVDKLLISFDVDNRIAPTGQTDVYVLVIGPDGQPISAESLGSGTFTTREEGDKAFTAKVPVDIETAKRRNVEFGFAPGTDFQQGQYTIQIYQNGFKIGEGKRELKKGGLFG